MKPLRLCCMAKSIIKIAFFFTIPIKSITPIKAITENSVPVNISAINAPTPAEGRVDKIVIGCSKLSYRTPKTKYKVAKAAKINQGWVAKDF